MGFNGNKANQTSGDILNIKVQNFHMHHCYIKEAFQDGIVLKKVGSPDVTKSQINQILETYVYNCGRHGFYVESVSPQILNCYAWSNGDGNEGAGLCIARGEAEVQNFVAWHNDYGIKIEKGGIIKVRNCYLDSNYKHQLYLKCVGGDIPRCTLKDIYFIRNVAPSNEYDCIYAEGDSTAPYYVEYCEFDRLYVNRGTQDFRYVIHLRGFTRWNRVGRISVIAIGTDYVNDASGLPQRIELRHLANLGLLKYGRNSGTATFSGKETITTFTIPHGLVSTPTVVKLEAKTADAAGDKYWTADATNITVTFLTAPPAGTGNVVLSWEAEV